MLCYVTYYPQPQYEERKKLPTSLCTVVTFISVVIVFYPRTIEIVQVSRIISLGLFQRLQLLFALLNLWRSWNTGKQLECQLESQVKKRYWVKCGMRKVKMWNRKCGMTLIGRASSHGRKSMTVGSSKRHLTG